MTSNAAKCTFTNLGCNLAIYLIFTADNSYPALTNLLLDILDGNLACEFILYACDISPGCEVAWSEPHRTLWQCPWHVWLNNIDDCVSSLILWCHPFGSKLSSRSVL